MANSMRAALEELGVNLRLSLHRLRALDNDLHRRNGVAMANAADRRWSGNIPAAAAAEEEWRVTLANLDRRWGVARDNASDRFWNRDMIKDLRDAKLYGAALEFIEPTKSGGMKRSVDKAIYLDLIAKVKGLESAESYISRLKDSEKNLRIYTSLLNCYCDESAADKAIALYEKIKELFVVSRPFIYNMLMALYLKLGQPDKVKTIFQEMKANNVFPDISSYKMLIKGCASLNEIDLVEKIVLEMKSGGVELDWSTYVTLAQVYNPAGHLEKAKSAIKNVEKLMGTYNEVGFHFLISSYADAGDLAEVNRVWNSLKATFKKPNKMCYLTMLRALNKLNDFDALNQCFQEWESDYNTYDIRLVNVMIEAYLRKNMMMEAESLFEKVIFEGVGSESSYTRTLELLINYLVKKHKMDFTLKSFEVRTSQGKQKQCKLDAEKVDEFLELFWKGDDLHGSKMLIDILIRTPHDPVRDVELEL